MSGVTALESVAFVRLPDNLPQSYSVATVPKFAESWFYETKYFKFC
jgi:hypothetical protein